MKRNGKWKIPHTLLERRALCVHSYKNCKLKVKPWWIGASEKKRIFCNVLFCTKESPVNVQNIYAVTYQKIWLDTLFCLLIKSSKAFGVS